MEKVDLVAPAFAEPVVKLVPPYYNMNVFKTLTSLFET